MESKSHTRIELVQSAVRVFLMNVKHHPDHRVRFFFFNHKTEMVQGSFDELQSRMDRIEPDQDTNMILCLQQMKSQYDLLSEEEQKRVVCGILTDGMHNADSDLKIDTLLEDSFYTNLFRSIIGIGSRDSVDYDILTKLTGGRQDVFHLVSEETEVFHAMNGTFFDMLISSITNATFSIWCKNDDQLLHMAHVKKVYHTEYQTIQVLPECPFMKMKYDKTTYLIEYQPEQKESISPLDFWLSIDVSGSMECPIYQSRVEILEEFDSVSPYIEIQMNVSSVNEYTHLIGCGNVLYSTITFTHNGQLQTMLIPCQEPESTHTMNFCKNLLFVSNELGKVLDKKQVGQLYKDHLYLFPIVESNLLPPWLKTHGKLVCKKLKQRYVSSLTRGEQFFEQTPISYESMLRAISSEASSQSAFSNQVNMDREMTCKLCYDQQINILFPDCLHAGLCKDCYITYRNTGKNDCPFCRTLVSRWTVIHIKNGFCQEPNCYEYCSYMGHSNEKGLESCGHLLYCKTCIHKNKVDSSVFCKECNHHVSSIKIHLC